MPCLMSSTIARSVARDVSLLFGAQSCCRSVCQCVHTGDVHVVANCVLVCVLYHCGKCWRECICDVHACLRVCRCHCAKSWRACICDVQACTRVCSFVRMCMCVRMYTHTHIRALLLHEACITDASDMHSSSLSVISSNKTLHRKYCSSFVFVLLFPPGGTGNTASEFVPLCNTARASDQFRWP